MKNNTQRNGSQNGSISQHKQLSFYEENYILEPEDTDEDNYFYADQVYNLSSMDFIFN